MPVVPVAPSPPPCVCVCVAGACTCAHTRARDTRTHTPAHDTHAPHTREASLDEWPAIPTPADLATSEPRVVCPKCGDTVARLEMGVCAACLWRPARLDAALDMGYSGLDAEETP